ncbi:MAG: methionine--tRNA ligase [Candidatus Eisenbacteria bacterium]|uniref:Methionine--tRNA ligase n=1 Tax=Eiseniibacteriota bacterium TaxID=2212470 RepID=A0A948RTX9_UNCEI|nr:methionine--tRNA ligase [Candidatus Eisenbacteria bacterium]MBU1950515.1 methionine--tRNA ligase [Candidatus Eisenbacteria bacterium]MBU2690950.1 methionine--tRNA ligase [Candidatus Eisenbacteria bacterium]
MTDLEKGRHILVCVAWPYANAALHLGHMAGCYLPADIFARYHRLVGSDMIMVSGSDMHGTPIALAAEAEGVAPAVIAERNHGINTKALLDLDIKFDLFTSTATENHRQVVQELFLNLYNKGYVIPKTQKNPYCVSCSRFLADRFVEGECPHCGDSGARGDQCDHCGKTLDPQELINPRCKQSGDTPEFRETEHLFLRLSAFEKELLEWIEPKSHWRPNVINFTRNWLKEGLNDRAITRDLEYGIPIPLDGFEGKRIYVWFEAVIGYLSASKEWAQRSGDPDAWKRWWQNPEARSFYFLGKDNIPFHTIIWPSMLMAHGGLNLPYDVPANEYLQLGGAKFSKSSGLGVWVSDVADKFQSDSIRYYLTNNMPETRDSSWEWKEFIERVNNELVGIFGNLCHRSLTFTRKRFGTIPPLGDLDGDDLEMLGRIEATGREISAELETCNFRRALRALMNLAQSGNQYFDKKAPWALVKTDKDACGSALHVCLKLLQALAVYCAPFTPKASERLWGYLGNTGPLSWEGALQRLETGRELAEPAILFEKVELEGEQEDSTK